jgi:putative hydrolases of HD superfamily
MSSNKRNVDFLFEVGHLRLMRRMWRRFFNSEVSNVAEHSFRVVWIALLLAKKEGVKNEEKILKMALVHDIPESRTGDVDYLSRLYADRNEELAINDMLDQTIFQEEFVQLWKEAEERKTIEAKIIKDADTLDVNLELREQIIQPVAEKFEVFREELVKPKLYTKSAKEFWSIIRKADVHDWHFKSRNRFSKGDWKKK